MAAGYLPAPGTELGPCIEKCQHRDCAETAKLVRGGRCKCDDCGALAYQMEG